MGNEGQILRCRKCNKIKKGVHLKSYNLKLCLDCFLDFFRKRVKETIDKFKMFRKEDKIAVAISGGKDSIALARVLKDLNYNITLFHINTNINKDNYSENSQKIVEIFAKSENLPLKILNLKDEIKVDIKTASKIYRKEICGICGMIKRYLLNREAKNFDVIVTGHTLDDEASFLLSSLIFWKDILKRQWPVLEEKNGLKRRAKPLTLIFEKETKLFCKILNLPFNSQSCPFRSDIHFVFKNFIYKLEEEMPSSVLSFYKGFLKRKEKLDFIKNQTNLQSCERCGYLTINTICNFCKLKEKINKFLEKSK